MSGLLLGATLMGCAPVNHHGRLSALSPQPMAASTEPAGGEAVWSGDPLAVGSFVIRDPQPFFTFDGPSAGGAKFEIEVCQADRCYKLFTVEPDAQATPVFNAWLGLAEENAGFERELNFARQRVRVTLCDYEELGFSASAYFRIRTRTADGSLSPWIMGTRNDGLSTSSAPGCSL